MTMPRAGVRLLRRGGERLLDAILPRLCPGCGVELPRGFWICLACRRKFRPAPREAICFLCRARDRVGGDREAGIGCHDPDHRLLLGRAAFWMETPLDRVVHALKYGGRSDLGRPLGRLLARRVAPAGSALGLALPLHRTRRRDRGYNQAACLARAAGGCWGMPVIEGPLARARATRPQARLDQDRRRANIEGAFRVIRPALVAGRTWVLIDDVATTGSTLVEAALALRRSGAERVMPVAVALA